MRCTSHKTKPDGFTLLELLIVVALIAIMVGMSVVVMSGIADEAQEEATAATIRKIDGLLQTRIEAFTRAFDGGGSFRTRYESAARETLVQIYDRTITGTVHDTTYGARQHFLAFVRKETVSILAKKIAFRHLFPQRHEDLLILGFDQTGTVFHRDFQTDSATVVSAANRKIDLDGNRIADVVDATVTDTSLPNVHVTDAFPDDETVSSELMYWFLIHSGGFGAAPIGADRFSPAEVADTDEDGLLEFVDAWGHPLRFYRWPTALIDWDAPGNPLSAVPAFQPNLIALGEETDIREISAEERKVVNVLFKGLPPAPTDLPSGAIPRDFLLTDPDDPIGRLYAEMERFGPAPGPAFAEEYNAHLYHTPETYHTPLIMSAGIDEELGLHEPSDGSNGGHIAQIIDTTNLEPLLDNLTNRNRRAGGRR